MSNGQGQAPATPKTDGWTIEVPVLKHIQIRATGHEKGQYLSWSSPLLDANNLPLTLLPMPVSSEREPKSSPTTDTTLLEGDNNE